MRRATTNDVSSSGTASTSSGSTSVASAAVLSSPCTRHGREREPEQQRAGVAHEDPRRIEVVAQEAEAGAEDDRGQDRRVRPAERRARSGRTRTAEIAQTPAASPSSPSRKLTMFITATIATHRQRDPDPRRQLVHADEREREAVHPDAEHARDRRPRASARRASPTSAGRGSRRSRRPSSRPPRRAGSRASRRRAAGTRAPARRCRGRARCRRAAARVPALGRRPPSARSTTPSRRAMPPTAGVSSTTTTSATSAPQTTSRLLGELAPDHARRYFVP